MRASVAVVALGLLLGSCHQSAIVGSLTCTTSSDCLPPSSICSADGRCVIGCAGNPNLCISGSTCDATTGECTGGSTQRCGQDSDCDPPDLVCSQVGLCSPGCTITLDCSGGTDCDAMTGHCCTPGVDGCPQPISQPSSSCNSDAECPNAPATICSGGTCVAGCANGGTCAAPLQCDPPSGHCITPVCARDMDCDPGSYCTQANSCAVLAFGGAIACAEGTEVTSTCAAEETPAAFTKCAGKPGPVGCPYCIDGSCLHPGLCATSDDCHGGDGCVSGLCRVLEPQCPTVVTVADINAGVYAAGKEVCVKGLVTQVRQGYDGETEIKLGDTPYLYVDIEDMYGLTSPTVGQTVTVHGTVRWDQGHQDRELLPVDWVGM